MKVSYHSRFYLKYSPLGNIVQRYRTKIIEIVQNEIVLHCVSHDYTLIEQFGHAQIANLYAVLAGEKHVDGLDITVQHPIRM